MLSRNYFDAGNTPSTMMQSLAAMRLNLRCGRRVLRRDRWVDNAVIVNLVVRRPQFQQTEKVQQAADVVPRQLTLDKPETVQDIPRRNKMLGCSVLPSPTHPRTPIMMPPRHSTSRLRICKNLRGGSPPDRGRSELPQISKPGTSTHPTLAAMRRHKPGHLMPRST
ncbi:hypothetical protein VTI28DRAFT_5290 [Corynascus sepedonium]